jgi:YVTN family beta-propeller protein
MQDSDQLAVVDLETRAVVRTYPTGGREGHMVRLSPDGSRAYVTSRLGQGTLSVIFLEEERPPVVIETGPGAEGLDVTPDGGEVWVINRRTESISIIDTESLEIVATINARPFAGRIDMGPDGRAIVPNGTSSEQVPQYLRLYDLESREMLIEALLRDGQPQAGNFGVLIQDGLAYASDPRAGTIKVFSLEAMGTPEVLVTNHEGPDGMAWSPIRVNVMTQDANQ